MKKLILLLNDYPSTGKSTLARCFSNYLSRFGVSHQLKTLVEETESDDEDSLLDASRITPRSFLQMVADSPITVLEVATGQGDFFKKFYTNHALDALLDEAGASLSVVLPVTSESESFDSVIEAAEVFSDHAEYLIAHLVTSNYEDAEKVWDQSYAARVMDMFEAVELHIPEVGFQIEHELHARHMDLSDVLLDDRLQESLGKDFAKWQNRVLGQVESARQFLFGVAFRPTLQPRPTAKKGRTKVRSL
jgi:hypothetical protein